MPIFYSGAASRYSPYLERYPYDRDRPLSALPPPAPSRRLTNVKRSSTMAGLDVTCDKKPTVFQARPLKSLTVLNGSREDLRRSPSVCSDYGYGVRSRSVSSVPMRRIYPQTSAYSDVDDLEDKEDSSVVFDANLTFVLGTKSQMRQNLNVVPAHLDKETASNALSHKISAFLNRTDHVMDEWKTMGRKDDDSLSLRSQRYLGRSRSATNIMIKGFQYFSRANSTSRSSMARESLSRDFNDDATDCDEVLTQQGVVYVIVDLAQLTGLETIRRIYRATIISERSFNTAPFRHKK